MAVFFGVRFEPAFNILAGWHSPWYFTESIHPLCVNFSTWGEEVKQEDLWQAGPDEM